MSQDPLQDLLRLADQAAGPPPEGESGLAGRVLATRRRQRRVRTIGGTLAALVVTVGVAAMLGRSDQEPLNVEGGPSPAAVDNQSEVERLRAEVEVLRSRADRAMALARRLVEMREGRVRLAALKEKIPARNPLEHARREVDRAAMIIVLQADRMYHQCGLTEPALESYHQVIELFPDRPAANIARARLDQLQTQRGDSL